MHAKCEFHLNFLNFTRISAYDVAAQSLFTVIIHLNDVPNEAKRILKLHINLDFNRTPDNQYESRMLPFTKVKQKSASVLYPAVLCFLQCECFVYETFNQDKMHLKQQQQNVDEEEEEPARQKAKLKTKTVLRLYQLKIFLLGL